MGNEYIGGYTPSFSAIKNNVEVSVQFCEVMFVRQRHYSTSNKYLYCASVLICYSDVCDAIANAPCGSFRNIANHKFVERVHLVLRAMNVLEETFKSWQSDIINDFITMNIFSLSI